MRIIVPPAGTHCGQARVALDRLLDEQKTPTLPVHNVRMSLRKALTSTTITGNGYLQQFLEHYPLGTKGRLALALLLFAGARRQDVVTFGRQHVSDGWIRYVPKKTLYKRRDVSQKPFLPVLTDIIASSPCGSLTFLETAQGRPFTAAGFGNWFRDRCDKAGLPQCSAHGLKKAGATRLTSKAYLYSIISSAMEGTPGRHSMNSSLLPSAMSDAKISAAFARYFSTVSVNR
jgi:integrase